MHWVDVAIVVVIAASVIFGAIRGLVVELGSIIGAALGILVAQHTYRTALNFLALFFHKDAHLEVVAYILVFLIVWGLVTTLAQMVRAGLRFTPFGMLDRMGGAVIGLVLGILTVEILLLVASASHDASLHSSIRASKLAPTFEKAIPGLRHAVPQTLTKL